MSTAKQNSDIFKSTLTCYEEQEKQLLMSILSINKKRATLKNNLAKDIKNIYSENPESVLKTNEFLNLIGFEDFITIMAEVAKTRLIESQEITENFMEQIEHNLNLLKENKNIFNIYKTIFDNLSNDANRLWFAMFCSGICSVYYKFKVAEDFLTNNVGIKTKHCLGNHIKQQGYNIKTQQAALEISIEKNSRDNFEEMANVIENLINMNYKNEKISILESSLSYRFTYHIFIEKNKDSEVFPKIKRSTSYNEEEIFTSNGETLKERLYNTFEYISENLYRPSY